MTISSKDLDVHIPLPGSPAFQLRLLAHLSPDEALVDLFRSGHNPHDETQSRLTARGLQITRAQAKTVNFSIC